jgi:hypothetical protein
MRSVVRDPGLAEHLSAVAAGELLIVVAVLRVRALQALLIVERMRGSPQRDNRPAGVRIIDDLFHLLVRQFQPASEEDHKIRAAQRLDARNIVDRVGVYLSGLAIDRK